MRVRLAELVAALSLGIDLGFGQPMEHVLRQCLIALRLAEQAGLDEDERVVVYYTALLVNVGCHSDAHEQSKWFGDDIALRSSKYDHEMGGVRDLVSAIARVGSGQAVLQRFRIGVELAVSGWRDLEPMITQHAALARELAARLGLSEEVQQAVGSSYEQWDGKGWPGLRRGEDVPVAARCAQLAEFVEVAHRVGGVEAALALARKRSGGQFDPGLCTVLCDRAELILGSLGGAQTWDAVLQAEPALGVHLTGDEFDAALLAVADFVDLKSPSTLGHARGVSALAAAAAEDLGLDVVLLRRAGLVLGLGRLGVSNAIWDKPGPLGAGERERVRLQPYLTERMLQQSAALQPLGRLAAQHRERLDGTGYPRGLTGAAIAEPARVLAAADAYQSMREPRAYRAALTAEQAQKELRTDVHAGRLDGRAVDAVLAAAGHRVGARREGPAGLTAREVDVLRLLARGLSSRQIATELVISPKTARNHTEHIYTKIGATSRATASLFAMQQGLLP